MAGMRRMGRWIVVAVAASTAATLAGAADVAPAGAAADWPGWRGPNRDGKSPDTGLLKQWPADGPKQLWQISGIGKGFSSVSVSGGVVYTAGDVGDRLVVTALGPDGKVRWRMPADRAWTGSPPGSRSTPTIDAGKLYVLGGHGTLACLAAPTGKRLWSTEMGRLGGRPGEWGYAESPLIFGSLVLVKPGGANCIVALNKQTGRPTWATKGFIAGPEYSSCYLFTHNLVEMVATGTRSGIVCVAPRTGRVLWSNGFSANNTANCPTPVYADGYVFWANGYGKGGLCMKLGGTAARVTAKEAWRTADMDCHHGGYIVHEGRIYGNNGGGWACIELAGGKTRWTARGVGKGSLCFADGMLYLFSESGGRAALATCSPDGLEIQGRLTVRGSGPSWAHPVVIGGRLYLRYDDNLYCFDVKAP